MAAVSWIRRENELKGIAPTWETISEKLSEPLADSANEGGLEMLSPSPHPRTLARKVSRLAKAYGYKVGIVEQTMPLTQETARNNATFLVESLHRPRSHPSSLINGVSRPARNISPCPRSFPCISHLCAHRN